MHQAAYAFAVATFAIDLAPVASVLRRVAKRFVMRGIGGPDAVVSCAEPRRTLPSLPTTHGIDTVNHAAGVEGQAWYAPTVMEPAVGIAKEKTTAAPAICATERGSFPLYVRFARELARTNRQLVQDVASMLVSCEVNDPWQIRRSTIGCMPGGGSVLDDGWVDRAARVTYVVGVSSATRQSVRELAAV